MDYFKIGEFLKELRIENKLTQKEVAEILVVTPQTISKWELGTSLPSIDMLQALSQVFHVTVDEIINCKLDDINGKNKSKFDSKNSLSFLLYLLLFTIGILLCFVNYLVVDSRSIEMGPLNFLVQEYSDQIPISVKLGNWPVLILTIFLPVLLATLHVLDKRKQILLFIDVLSILLLITFLVPVITSPGFINVDIGLMLHIIYTLLMILSTIITLSYLKIDIYRLINNHKREFISSIILILITIALPFNYYDHGYYYFRTSEHVMLFFMLVAPCIMIYETIQGSKFFATLFYLILGISLIFSSLVNIFNDGLLICSFMQLIYLLFLAVPFYKQKRFSNNLQKIKLLSNFLYLEIISLVIYLFYYVNPGDIFFSINTDDIVFITTTRVGKFFHLNIIILLIAMIIRLANFKLTTKMIDLIWIIWVGYFTQGILFDYVLNKNYKTTDGIFLFIPPLLIFLYIFFQLINFIKNDKSTKIRKW